jgi:predicted nucleotidyltransferase
VDKTAILKIISKFKLALEEKEILVETIILYGSYAKNNARLGSDIDLIVISKSFKNMSLSRRMEILTDAIYDVHAPIEALAYTPIEWKNKQTMIKGFAKEGLVIS